MDASEKGARYARYFRQAGTHLAHGRIERALKVLEEGRAFAQANLDEGMAQRFADEVRRANTTLKSNQE